MKDRAELFRILRTPDGEFIYDKAGNKDGRGAYVCKDETCIDIAIKKRGLNQSFHGNVGQAAYEILDKLHEEIKDETG